MRYAIVIILFLALVIPTAGQHNGVPETKAKNWRGLLEQQSRYTSSGSLEERSGLTETRVRNLGKKLIEQGVSPEHALGRRIVAVKINVEFIYEGEPDEFTLQLYHKDEDDLFGSSAEDDLFGSDEDPFSEDAADDLFSSEDDLFAEDPFDEEDDLFGEDPFDEEDDDGAWEDLFGSSDENIKAEIESLDEVSDEEGDP